MDLVDSLIEDAARLALGLMLEPVAVKKKKVCHVGSRGRHCRHVKLVVGFTVF